MQEKIKKRELEWRRQFFHIIFGVVIVVLLMYGLIDKHVIFWIIIIGLSLSYLSTMVKIPIINFLLWKFERDEWAKKFPGKGMIFYLIGADISLFLFPKEVAMASIMVLAFGDSVSHIFGLHYGKMKHPLSDKKFLEGTIAGFVMGFIGAFVFLRWYEALLASLIAMTAEAIEMKIGTSQVDDNLVIPVIAGAVVWVIRWII